MTLRSPGSVLKPFGSFIGIKYVTRQHDVEKFVASQRFLAKGFVEVPFAVLLSERCTWILGTGNCLWCGGRIVSRITKTPDSSGIWRIITIKQAKRFDC